MVEELFEAALAEGQASPLLNLYLSHNRFSSST